MCLRLRDDLDAMLPRSRGGLRADHDDRNVPRGGTGERARRGRRGEQDNVDLRRFLRGKLDAAVQRHEVGAKRVDEQAPRSFGRRDEHAARRLRELGPKSYAAVAYEVAFRVKPPIALLERYVDGPRPHLRDRAPPGS